MIRQMGITFITYFMFLAYNFISETQNLLYMDVYKIEDYVQLCSFKKSVYIIDGKFFSCMVFI